MIGAGFPFFKMSGSGNDFVMFDAREAPLAGFMVPSVVQRICARGTGVGADGLVFLEPSDSAAVRLVYLNADGSRADFCGNATLCTARLAVELGAGAADGLIVETDSGLVSARVRDGQPEIDLQPVEELIPQWTQPLAPGELQMGFALVGVPHVVILCDDVSTVDVVGRGRPLRYHPSLAHGANVNFVSRAGGAWRIRTYERGVEGETLACGSGSVATAILLTTWGEASGPVELRTSSGRSVVVTLRRDGERWLPSLRGEGRIVYHATLSEI